MGWGHSISQGSPHPVPPLASGSYCGLYFNNLIPIPLTSPAPSSSPRNLDDTQSLYLLLFPSSRALLSPYDHVTALCLSDPCSFHYLQFKAMSQPLTFLYHPSFLRIQLLLWSLPHLCVLSLSISFEEFAHPRKNSTYGTATANDIAAALVLSCKWIQGWSILTAVHLLTLFVPLVQLHALWLLLWYRYQFVSSIDKAWVPTALLSLPPGFSLTCLLDANPRMMGT